MDAKTLLVLLFTIQAYFCQNINEFFENINKNTLKFNQIASDIAWKSSIQPDDPNLPRISAEYQKNRIIWQNNVCDILATLSGHSLNETQKRMSYLLCRGPKFNFMEARYLSYLYKKLQSTYSNYKICLPSDNPISRYNGTEIEKTILKVIESHMVTDQYASPMKEICLNGEDDFENVMSVSKNHEVLKWTWWTWREMGLKLKRPYGELVEIENAAARRNGYSDIGEAWRDDLEIPHLRSLCRSLYDQIKPLYKLLHGVVRFFLRRQYGDVVPEKGNIPAYLFGNLWSQSWDSLIDIITPRLIDLNEAIKQHNWTVLYMVKRAEDFYQSLGLPAMTETFWRESIFTRENEDTRCHGAAADMFKDGDYRLIYCSSITMQDFYVLHHEMGHIQYYMAYEDQPGLFRQANTALHESIGDAIMYGVMTPQHLHRLGLINDTILFNNKIEKIPHGYEDNNVSTENLEASFENNIEGENDKNVDSAKISDGIEIDSTDDIIMLKQALNKIPQIPFSLIIDEYRWKYFEGGISRDDENEVFWNMVEALSGISPPTNRGEEYFDIAAKFHVPDNTPYIRYFLSSFLQHQIFEALCKGAVFGRRDVDEDIPDTITMSRCDIYGSKTAGKILKDLMSQGHSQHWRKILSSSIGDDKISASPLLRYYRPLQDLLETFVKKYRVPIGW